MDEKATINLLRDIRGLLTYYRSLGISDYRRTPALDSFLKRLPDKPGRHDALRTGRPEKISPAGQVQSRSAATLADIRADLGDCTRCRLQARHGHIVFGQGRESAPLFIIGDSPSAGDDRTGEPFSDEAGDLLSRMLAAIKLRRADVYLTHIVKCRPPDDRPPEKDEIESCLPFLYRQIEAAGPRIICTMGPLATRVLLKTGKPLLRLRGRFYDFRLGNNSTLQVIPTFHPAFLIKNPEMKKGSWQDLQLIARKLQTG